MITTWSTSGLSDTALAAFAFILPPWKRLCALMEFAIFHSGLLIVKTSAEGKSSVSPYPTKRVVGKNTANGTIAIIL
jgi:hypothetical protein